MPKFSNSSKSKLNTCHDKLQLVFNEVIKHWDCTILEGTRSKETQDEYFRTGRSEVRYPNSKHNSSPSEAVDVAPYPIDWKDLDRFRAFGNFVLGVASANNVKLRWGGDWDGDRSFADQSFHDLPHFELLEE